MNIDIQKLTKTYSNGVTALNEISLNLQPGITGLLGPNGAGKSTLIKLLTELEKPTSGQIDYVDDSKASFNLKQQLGYVPQSFGLPETLTGQEFLTYMATAKGLDFRDAKKKISDLLAALRLTTVSKQRIATYSGGMKQRLGIAQALLNQPQLLILDEPTVGLDPDERFNLRQIMTELAGQTIILLSTHIVSDVESVANKIVLMNQGEIKIAGTTEELLALIADCVWELMIKPEDYPAIQTEYLISSSYRHRDDIKVRLISTSQPQGAVSVTPTLEEVYLFYTHEKHVRERKEGVS